MAINNFLRNVVEDPTSLSAAEESLKGLKGTEAAEEGIVNVELTEEDEAIVLMESILEESTPEEFSAIMESAGYDMALYGILPSEASVESIQKVANGMVKGNELSFAIESIIDSGEPATEASKKMVVKDWKSANMNRISKRMAIRMAARDKSPAYAKYIKHRAAMIDAREEIYRKYGKDAVTYTKKVLKGGKQKASNMGGSAGKALEKKIDKQLKKLP